MTGTDRSTGRVENLSAWSCWHGQGQVVKNTIRLGAGLFVSCRHRHNTPGRLAVSPPPLSFVLLTTSFPSFFLFLRFSPFVCSTPRTLRLPAATSAIVVRGVAILAKMRSRASFLAATLLSAHAVLPVGAQESSNGPVDVPAVDKFVALIGGRGESRYHSVCS